LRDPNTEQWDTAQGSCSRRSEAARELWVALVTRESALQITGHCVKFSCELGQEQMGHMTAAFGGF
jgi:hypothetical protein